jgi:hypothetical protein
MPLALITWEAEIGMIMVRGHSKKKKKAKNTHPFQPIKAESGGALSSQLIGKYK